MEIQGKGKVEQVWNKKIMQQEKIGISTGNMFGALDNNEETGETKDYQLRENKSSGTKKQVKETLEGGGL